MKRVAGNQGFYREHSVPVLSLSLFSASSEAQSHALNSAARVESSSSFLPSSISPLVHSQACNPDTTGGLPHLLMGETDFGC